MDFLSEVRVKIFYCHKLFCLRVGTAWSSGLAHSFSFHAAQEFRSSNLGVFNLFISSCVPRQCTVLHSIGEVYGFGFGQAQFTRIANKTPLNDEFIMRKGRKRRERERERRRWE